ncbi:MAG: hypothetical protein HY289_03100 [Planctomycetes bacterium]|nr:hypothetical protein [Planctomycetota bacterium]
MPLYPALGKNGIASLGEFIKPIRITKLRKNEKHENDAEGLLTITLSFRDVVFSWFRDSYLLRNGCGLAALSARLGGPGYEYRDSCSFADST